MGWDQKHLKFPTYGHRNSNGSATRISHGGHEIPRSAGRMAPTALRGQRIPLAGSLSTSTSWAWSTESSFRLLFSFSSSLRR